jgi:hypothetical protein
MQFPTIETIMIIARHTTMKYRIISSVPDSPGHGALSVVEFVIVVIK